MPKKEWKQVIDAHPKEAQKDLLKRVLRTRKRGLDIWLNGICYIVKRSVVRDYLREILAK